MQRGADTYAGEYGVVEVLAVTGRSVRHAKDKVHDESGAVKRDGYEVVWYTKTRESNREIVLTSNTKIFLRHSRVTFLQRNRWKIEYLPMKQQSVAKCRM